MQKWEYIAVYVAISPDFNFMTKVGSEIVSGGKVWEYINALGLDGWEMVSVVERIGNELPPQSAEENIGRAGAFLGAMMAGDTALTVTQHKAVTLGYLYHFKREPLPKTNPLKVKSTE